MRTADKQQQRKDYGVEEVTSLCDNYHILKGITDDYLNEFCV